MKKEVKSIIPGDDNLCYICKKFGNTMFGTDRHHCIFGVGKRDIADREGLTVHLCHYHHVQLHDHGMYKKDLQQLAERTWLEHNNKTVDDWIALFGKNYLE